MFQVLCLGALTLSLGGILISWLVGIKLPGLEYNNQKVEAAFRKELVYGEDDIENYISPNNITVIYELLNSIIINFFFIMVILIYGLFGTDNYL